MACESRPAKNPSSMGTSSSDTTRMAILERVDQNALARKRPRPSTSATVSPDSSEAGALSTSAR